MFGVGAFTVSHHDHHVCFAGDFCRLRLTFMRSITYCIKDFYVCTLFFYDFPRSFKKFSDAGGLRYYGNRDFPTFLIPVQPGLHGLRPVEHQGLAAPAGHPHHLRVQGFADDHRTTALRLRLGH